MRILFAGGGTAGHINPALAIAGHVKQKNPECQILFVGSKGGMEEDLVAKAGFKIKTITVSGFKRSMNFTSLKHNIKTVNKLIKATSQSKKIVEDFKPDLCVGTGGYVSGPILRKAAKMGVPIIIHEQNAFPGVTTKMLSKDAKVLMLAVADAQKYLKDSVKDKIVVTGNPVRTQVINANKELSKEQLKLDNRPVVLSFGGSLGAERVNKAVADLIAESSKTDCFQHIHAYGRYGKWFPELLNEKGVDIKKHSNLDIREYIDDMDKCLASADLVVCRSGAMTLSELQIQGKPSILIPSPNVAENHQYHNAMALVNRNAACIIEEKDLTGELLTKKAFEILNDSKKLEQLGANAKKMAIVDTNDIIYNIIIKIVQGK